MLSSILYIDFHKKKRDWRAPVPLAVSSVPRINRWRAPQRDARITLVIHAAHAAAAVTAARRSRFFLFRQLGDQALGGEQQTSDGSRVLERAAGDLLGINHTGLHEVFVFVGGNV